MRAAAFVIVIAAAAHAAPPVSIVFDQPTVLQNPLIESIDFDLSPAFGLQGAAGLTPSGRVWAGARFSIARPGGLDDTTGVLVESDTVGIRAVPADVADSLPPGRSLVSLRPRWFDDNDHIYATGFTLADGAKVADAAIFLADAQGGYRTLLPDDFVGKDENPYPTAPSLARVTPDAGFLAIPYPPSTSGSFAIGAPRPPLIAGDLHTVVPVLPGAGVTDLNAEDRRVHYDPDSGFFLLRADSLAFSAPPFDSVESLYGIEEFPLQGGGSVNAEPRSLWLSSNSIAALTVDDADANTPAVLVGPPAGPFRRTAVLADLLPDEDYQSLTQEIIALAPNAAAIIRVTRPFDPLSPVRHYLHRPGFETSLLLATNQEIPGLPAGLTVDAVHRAVVSSSGVGLLLVRFDSPGAPSARPDALLAFTIDPQTLDHTFTIVALEGAPIPTDGAGFTPTLASLDTALGDLDNDQLVHTSGRAVFQAVFDDASIAVLDVQLGSGPCNAVDLAVPFGLLDNSDVIAFLNAFGSQSPLADFQPDAVFDFLDVFVWLQRYAAGCP